MKHSIISWDCSYRNFFHLIDALIEQDYDKNEYELIYVEQRSRDFADKYNHENGLKSLHDRYNEVKDNIQIKIEYLNHKMGIPYHLGLCVNRGLEFAEGEIISVMDGDMLLPDDFLKKLDLFHLDNKAIANIVRRMVPEPVGVDLKNWLDATIDYQKCLRACPDANNPIPEKVSNKGPMISASREAWNSINGYDEHKIWSTGLSRLGQDVCARLENYLNCDSYTLSNCVAVHPYHPTGFSRRTFNSVRLLSIQENIIEWSKKNNIYNWRERIQLLEEIFSNNQSLMIEMLDSKLSRPDQGKWYNSTKLGSSNLLGEVYHRMRKLIRLIPIEWRV